MLASDCPGTVRTEASLYPQVLEHAGLLPPQEVRSVESLQLLPRQRSDIIGAGSIADVCT